MERASGRILATAFAPGATHDFALFKMSRLHFAVSTQVLADSGYQGLGTWHHASQTPRKKSKHKPLTPEQKQQNKELASQRIRCEHVFAALKHFAILRGPYRNHTKRLALRFNLIAALHNYHL